LLVFYLLELNIDVMSISRTIKLSNFIGQVVICPKCGKPGILAIVKKKRKYKNRVYEYEYVVVRHANTNHHLGKLDEDIIKTLEKLKVIEI